MSAQSINDLVISMLVDRGRPAEILPEDALFTSGLLDSLAATELMMTLESEYNIDLADADFDISQLDTINDLSALVARA